LEGHIKESGWSRAEIIALREEHGLRVSENRVLRRIFGHKR
jgi:uncharacterized protein YllA (UPF0747 family)